MAEVQIIKHGKAKRLRSKNDVRHRPTLRGIGKWESLACFWRYKRKSRRLRKIADESRRRNRAA